VCGQAGIVGSIDAKSEKVFQKLLIYNSTRGIDSTGAASVKRIPNKDTSIEIVVAKEVGHPFNLFGIKRDKEADFSDVLAGTHRALMGHCRASTRGASTRFNAHPFVFNRIVGTHNGTLSPATQNSLVGGFKFDTDSEAFFNEIEAFGIEETMKKVSTYSKSGQWYSCPDAYAIVWYDSGDNSFNMLRNLERPLFFAFDKKKEQLFYSSEEVHLVAAMTDVDHETNFIYELPEDKLYKWIIPNYGQPFGKASVKTMEGKKSNPFTARTTSTATGNHSTGYHDNYLPNGDSRIAWKDRATGFFVRHNDKKNIHRYGELEHGVYYDSVQECWNHLSEPVKRARVIANDIPDGVESGYYYDDNLNEYIQEPKKELEKAVSDNRKDIVKMYDEAVLKKLREVTLNDTKCVQVYQDKYRTAYFDQGNKNFVLYTFMGMHTEPAFDRQTLKHLPIAIPFTNLDVNARHQFKHIGKGKKRITYFKGFQGHMLVKESFEKLMEHGCLECKRRPGWGHDVLFVDASAFLCEYCKYNSDKVQEWKEAAKIIN
jgi:hypothetical protein